MLIMLTIWPKKRLERSISDLLFKLLALQNQTVQKSSCENWFSANTKHEVIFLRKSENLCI